MRSSRKGAWRLVALLAAAMMLMAACGKSKDNSSTATTSGGAKTKVAIAFVGPLTGDNANLGINIRDGMKVAIEEQNAKSTKYEYSIKEFDTQGDPAQAPGQSAKYIPDDSIIGIVGPTFSGETKAVLPELDKAGLVMISASATNVALPDVVPNTKVFHRVIPDDGVQAQGVTDYVTKVLKPKKVGLIHDNTEYGKGLWEGVVKLLNDAKIDTSTTDSIDPKSQDYSAAVNKMKAANVDLIFYGGYYNEAGRLKKQLTDAGVKAKFISGDGSLDPGFVVSSGAAGGEGALLTCPCRLATPDLPGLGGPFAKSYNTLIKKAPGTYSSEGYDSINILIKGIEAGNATRPKLLDYVENLSSFNGVSKTISFEANGNVKAGDVFIYQVKSGKIVELGKTSELAK
ncbi:MAG: branched-chain amino acid transport system substrate-binding protein [Actinomycetota bacterium]|nr:branched-chain amino acid transport system substrate-binding protein [Actinomycetota bacterium]